MGDSGGRKKEVSPGRVYCGRKSSIGMVRGGSACLRVISYAASEHGGIECGVQLVVVCGCLGLVHVY